VTVYKAKDGLERLIALLENGGIIEKTDETEDEIKTQVALRPTPTPILKPTPSPTPSPRPTGPSQEELLRQLLALMETTPSPTPEYPNNAGQVLNFTLHSDGSITTTP